MKLIKVRINAFRLSEFDIKANVPESIILKLKEKEDHPFLQAYVLAHPGEFTPEIEGEDNAPMVWDSKSIKSFSKIKTVGTLAYHGHDSREVLGEVVYSTFKDDSFIIVMHHPKDKVSIAATCDICSQEADWYTFEEGGKIFADRVEKLTGVALESSEKESPAFSGAKRIAQIYANEPKEKKNMTLAEVKQAVSDMNIQPYKLFSVDEVKLDPILGKEYNSALTENETLKSTLKEKETELETLSNEKNELSKSVAQSTAKERLTQLLTDKKCTDNQSKFINKLYEDVEDFSDEGLSKFVENSLKIYKVASEVNPQDKNPDAKPPEKESDSSYVPDIDLDDI